MSSRDIAELTPELQELCKKFLEQCHAENINAFLTCTYRSSEEQDILYAQGRTSPGKIVTNAKSGQSKHNERKAFDFAIKNSDGSLNWDTSTKEWIRAVDIGRTLGLTSGADFHSLKDYPHMEIA